LQRESVLGIVWAALLVTRLAGLCVGTSEIAAARVARHSRPQRNIPKIRSGFMTSWRLCDRPKYALRSLPPLLPKLAVLVQLAVRVGGVSKEAAAFLFTLLNQS
jgi:hypothetical protein